MAWSISRNFSFSFRPIYYFSRVFCLIPFTIVHDIIGDVVTSKVHAIDGVLFVGFVGLHLIVSAYFCITPIVPLPEIPHVLLLGGKIICAMTHFHTMITIIMNMYNRHEIIKILKMFNSIDKEMMFNNRFNVAIQSRCFSIVCLVLVVVAIVLAMIGYFLSPLNTKVAPYQFVFEVVMRISRLVAIPIPSIYFTVLLRSLHQRFVALNSSMRKRFCSENNSAVESTIAVKRIGRNHSALIDIMDKTNSCFSFQIMAIFGQTFVHSVITVYAIYEYILHQNGRMRGIFWAFSTWELPYLFSTLLVVYHADKLANEGKTTSKIVHEIINSWDDEDIISSLGYLSKQAQHRFPVAACKLFAFDWILIFNMSVAATCYLSIVLAFERTS